MTVDLKVDGCVQVKVGGYVPVKGRRIHPIP